MTAGRGAATPPTTDTRAARRSPFADDTPGYFALWYAATATIGGQRLGWQVFPLHTPTADGGCSCGDAACKNVGKHPRTANGLKNATADWDTLIGWWQRWPDANIGLACGASGLVALDFDTDKPDFGGQELLERLLAEHPTTAQRSGGGGWHLLYRLPDGADDVTTGTGDLPRQVHVRGHGGYIVLAPSRHRNGSGYAWAQGRNPYLTAPALLPDFVLDLIRRTRQAAPRPAAPRPAFSGGGDDVERARGWLARLNKSRCEDYAGDGAWVNVGMALSELGEAGLALWNEWSQQSAKYSPGECDRKWRTFTPGAGLRLGSLKHWADQDDPGGARSPRVQAYVNGGGPTHGGNGSARQPDPDPDPGPDPGPGPHARGDGGDGHDGQAPFVSGEKPNQADILYMLASDLCEIFTGQDTRAYALVPVEGRRECYGLNSDAFRGWLNEVYRRAYGRLPGMQGKQDAIAALAWDARKTQRDVFIRVGAAGGKVYLDLGTPEWDAIEVDADGWRLVDKPPVAFRRPGSLRELPTPLRGGHLSDLARFVNLEAEDWPLLAAWAVAALHPTGPYPVLVLAGEQGTAKSTTLQVLKRLIDPSVAGLRGQPQEVRDLFVGAGNSWLLTFDNVSALTHEISDALCRLATGGGYAKRANYSDDGEFLLDFQRPVAVNGIGDVVTRPDLMDRAVLLVPPVIAESRRRNEAAFWREFDEARPLLLGALLDALATAMRRLPSVQLERAPRMADFARLAVAAQPHLGGDFLTAYEVNRKEAHATVVETSTLGDHLRKLVVVAGTWEGSPSELLEALNQRATDSEKRARSWPSVPNRLKPQLERLAPSLRKVGVDVEFARTTDGRVIRLLRVND